jgi:hypothetical protein
VRAVHRTRGEPLDERGDRARRERRAGLRVALVTKSQPAPFGPETPRTVAAITADSEPGNAGAGERPPERPTLGRKSPKATLDR